MVRLRLQRHGSKKRPVYRIVAADQRAPRDGRYKELLGTFDPRTKPFTVNMKVDRVDYWLGVGAQPTDKVTSLIKRYKAGEVVTTDAVAETARQRRDDTRAAALNVAAVEVKKEEEPAAEAAAEAPAEEAAAEEAAAPAEAEASTAE